MAYVSRDPFARTEIHKATEQGTCAWCGGTNARGKVWRYRVETDGGRVFPDVRVFCSVGCRGSYGS